MCTHVSICCDPITLSPSFVVLVPATRPGTGSRALFLLKASHAGLPIHLVGDHVVRQGAYLGCLAMAQETYDLRYVVPRFVLYLALFIGAATDAIIHRHVKRRGYQLQRFVTITVGASA